MVDHISDICFAPCEYAVKNLLNENIDHHKISLVGNIMIDSLLENHERIKSSFNEIKSKLGISKDFFVVTLHRDENLNNEILEEIFTGLNTFSEDYDIILPAHPRLKNFIENNSIDTGNLLLIDSLRYVSFLSLVLNSKICLTDSGGLQEETSVLGIPCLTLREETERPITVEIGTNKVIGTKKANIIESIKLVLEFGKYKEAKIPLWDGKTSKRIVSVLKENYI
jgi:UDP-N-acetylglucosamine 2-epimerase (non-hydrolysing)